MFGLVTRVIGITTLVLSVLILWRAHCSSPRKFGIPAVMQVSYQVGMSGAPLTLAAPQYHLRAYHAEQAQESTQMHWQISQINHMHCGPTTTWRVLPLVT